MIHYRLGFDCITDLEESISGFERQIGVIIVICASTQMIGKVCKKVILQIVPKERHVHEATIPT